MNTTERLLIKGALATALGIYGAPALALLGSVCLGDEFLETIRRLAPDLFDEGAEGIKQLFHHVGGHFIAEDIGHALRRPASAAQADYRQGLLMAICDALQEQASEINALSAQDSWSPDFRARFFSSKDMREAEERLRTLFQLWTKRLEAIVGDKTGTMLDRLFPRWVAPPPGESKMTTEEFLSELTAYAQEGMGQPSLAWCDFFDTVLAPATSA